MVLRTRQRRQVEEFQQVNGQLFLYDTNVVKDFVGRVVGKAKDVAAVGENFRLLPREKHLAILRYLVLLFLSAEQIFGVDVLKTYEDALDSGARCLLYKIRKAMAERVHLYDEIYLKTFDLAQTYQAIKYCLPVSVTRKIVVRDEEAMNALRNVRADYALNVVGRAVARLATLNIYDRAEGALIRTAAPRVKTCVSASGTHDSLGWQKRHRSAFHVRQIVHEIVERLERFVEGVNQHLFETTFGLARKERDAHLCGACNVRVALLQHSNRA